MLKIWAYLLFIQKIKKKNSRNITVSQISAEKLKYRLAKDHMYMVFVSFFLIDQLTKLLDRLFCTTREKGKMPADQQNEMDLS